MYLLQRRATWPSGGYRNFQEAFLATLALLDFRVIVWRDDEHQRRFDRAMTRLRELQAEGAPGADQLPLAMHPATISGYYTDIQNALLLHLFVRIEMPSDGVAQIIVDRATAQALLDRIYKVSPEAQEILRQIAEAFMAPLPTQAVR